MLNYRDKELEIFYSGKGQGGAGLNFMPDKQYVKQNFYAADGGRAGYANGGY